MGQIKELPILERPREKAIRYGLNSLSDVELLTLLISKGYKGVNALEIATNLFITFNGLKNLAHAPIKELEKVKGIKEAKALNLAAIFELSKRLEIKNNEDTSQTINSLYLYNKYKSMLRGSNQETLIIIILSTKSQILHEKVLYIGTESNMIYSYKDIWRELLNYHAKYFYLIHNHPGGKSTPSREDIAFTSEINLEANRLKVKLLDHIIIGNDGYYSFAEEKK